MKLGKQQIPANSFFRFLLVGVINTIVGLGTAFLFLYLFHATYWVATFLGNGIGGGVSYFLNRSFTFQSKQPIKTSIWRFLLVVLCCYFFSYGISERIVEYFPFFSETMKQNVAVIVGAGLYTISNYFGQKKFVF